jgi:hypothetical protein
MLPAYPESLDDLLVAFGVLATEIGQVTPTLADHLDQATPRVLVVPV